MNPLKKLVRSLERAAAEYQTAAEKETNYELQSLLIQYSDQRLQYVEDLKPFAGSFVEEEEDKSPILAEEEEFDDSDTLLAYEQALELDLPDDARRMIERQYDAVAEAHDHLLELRNLVSDSPMEGNSDTYDSAVAEKDDTEPRDIKP